jgi:hypothetical protein
MLKAAMGRPYGLNHIAIGPMEIGPEAQAHQAANRVMRGERGVAYDLTSSPAASVAVPSRGQPLPSIHRAWLEPAFGADLGAVRVHHDAEAATAARAEHAHAFTAGRDIYFGQDRYDPHVQDGRHLLAHEVAHVLQQTAVTGSAHRLRATDAIGTGEVQRARAPHKGEDTPAVPGVFHAGVLAPARHDAPVAVQPMPGTVHQASAQVPRPAMSPVAKLPPATPRETDPSKIRRGRLP